MMPQLPQSDTKMKAFLNISSAAQLAGFSTRHFRRIIKEKEIPVMKIGRKFFIISKNLETLGLVQRKDRTGTCQ